MTKTLIAAAFVLFSTAAAADGFMPWTAVMAGADTNHDGAISMQEVRDYKLGSSFQGFQPWMTDHFAQCDTNHDGEIDHAELAACMKEMGMSDTQLSEVFFKGQGFMPRNQQ